MVEVKGQHYNPLVHNNRFYIPLLHIWLIPIIIQMVGSYFRLCM